MDILNRIITLLNKEELRNFKLHATRSHDHEDRKDIRYFDYVRRAGDKFNERKIIKELYGSGRKNTYHRLRNRLFTEINKSLVTLHWNSDTVIEAIHFLALSILFRQKQNFDIAHHFLRKSELKAQEHENLALMDLIYGEFINLSYHQPEINPETYIQLRNKNLERMNRLREMDNILAALNYRIRLSQNVGRGDENVLEILQHTVDEFSQDPELKDQPQFRFRMYNAVSRILLQQRDYPNLENYLLSTYEAFSQENLFDRSNHNTKLQMLCYIINALFKNGKTEESLEYILLLEVEMRAYGKLHYDQYLFFYYSSLATNYSLTDPHKSIRIFREMLENPKLKKVDNYKFYARVQLGQVLFLTDQFDKAARNLNKLKLLDSYINADAALQLKIELLEMAVRYEQGEYDVLEYRLGQIRKDFAGLAADPAHEKEFKMLDLIRQLANFPVGEIPEKWKEAARKYSETYQPDDTELFKYKEWLSRIIKT